MVGAKDRAAVSERDEDVPGVFDSEARAAYVGRLDPAIWGRIWIKGSLWLPRFVGVAFLQRGMGVMFVCESAI